MEHHTDGPVRVLHVLGNLGHGGAESRVMDLYRHMDRSRVQFDFAVHCDGERTPEYFDRMVEELGGNLYVLPRFKAYNLRAYKRAWRELFASQKGAWRVVQGHMTSTAAIYLPIAKAAGVPVTVAHARSAGTDPGIKGILTRYFRRPLQKDGTCDISFACTSKAGEAVFGARRMREDKVLILPNAIDIDGFAFDTGARERIRAEFNLSDAIVIGHVGRLNRVKNHDYLMQVFVQLRKKAAEETHTPGLSGRDLKLLLVGDGTLHAQEVRNLPVQYGIEKDVIFAGDRSDVSSFYSAFDHFVFPSLFEGLPGTVIEAQASGLPCLISDRITRDVEVSPLVRRRGIAEDPALWAEQIVADLTQKSAFDKAESFPLDRAGASESARVLLREAGFDVKAQAVRMMAFYESGKGWK